MNWKRKLLRDLLLYVIIDKEVLGKRPLAQIVRKVVSCGGIIFQLRAKNAPMRQVFEDALVLSKIAVENKSIFIVNDYPDIAKLSGADGVHLGQKDLRIRVVRRLLGKDLIIGISCFNIDQAIKAEREGADYIGIGPIFPTSTKPEAHPIGLDLIRQCRKIIRIPVFAIGGINQNNLKQVQAYGGNKVALCRAILGSGNIKKTTSEFLKLLN